MEPQIHNSAFAGDCHLPHQNESIRPRRRRRLAAEETVVLDRIHLDLRDIDASSCAYPLALATSVFAAQGIISAYQFSARYIARRIVRVGIVAAVLGLLLAHGIYRASHDARGSFAILPPKAREAMAWVAVNHPGARFAIINEKAWHDDHAGEWFPTLASARSVTTVQGREWNGQFGRWEEMSRALRASQNCADLRSTLAPFGSFEFVWVETMQHCFAPPRYRLVFRNDRVSIYNVRKFDS